jgi:hypothetical protein
VLKIDNTVGISLPIKKGTAKILTAKAAISSTIGRYMAIIKIIERWYLDF